MQYTHLNLTMPRLMFPEPEDNGNGAGGEEAIEQAESNETATTENEAANDNPFGIAFADGDTASDSEAEDEATENDEYSLGLTEEDGFDANEIPMLTELAQKHNLSAENASAFLKELNQEIVKQERANEQRNFDESTNTLRQKWGNAFEENVKKAGRMIQTVGSRLGWDKDKMSNMLNPHDIELMYEVSKMYGTSKIKGLSASAPVAKREMTREEINIRRTQLINEHYQARQRGDTAAMKKASDEHFELSKKISGANTVRILREK